MQAKGAEIVIRTSEMDDDSGREEVEEEEEEEEEGKKRQQEGSCHSACTGHGLLEEEGSLARRAAKEEMGSLGRDDTQRTPSETREAARETLSELCQTVPNDVKLFSG